MFHVVCATECSTVESARPEFIPNYGRVDYRGKYRIRIAVPDYGPLLGGVSDLYAHHEPHRVQPLRQSGAAPGFGDEPGGFAVVNHARGLLNAALRVEYESFDAYAGFEIR